MNLTTQQAALAWAQGKRVEAKAATHPDFLSVAPVGTDNGCWSGRVFGEGHENYDFRLTPEETIAALTASEPETPVDDGGPAYPCGPGGDSIIHEDGRVSHQWPAHPGMSLRQHYAGEAMKELCAYRASAQETAIKAIEYADALLAELRRKR